MNGKQLFRQGDVLIREIDPSAMPKSGLTVVKPDQGRRAVLAYGEVTGHAHAIYTPEKVELYRADEMTQFLKTTGDVELKHEEHSTIPLKGDKVYEIVQQREYDQLGQIRRVVD